MACSDGYGGHIAGRCRCQSAVQRSSTSAVRRLGSQSCRGGQTQPRAWERQRSTAGGQTTKWCKLYHLLLHTCTHAAVNRVVPRRQDAHRREHAEARSGSSMRRRRQRSGCVYRLLLRAVHRAWDGCRCARSRPQRGEHRRHVVAFDPQAREAMLQSAQWYDGLVDQCVWSGGSHARAGEEKPGPIGRRLGGRPRRRRKARAQAT